MSEAAGDIRPGAVLLGIAALLVGGASMAYNPFLLTSVLALLLGVATLHGASRVQHAVGRGVLRILAIIGIMGALGGVVALAWTGR